MIPETTGDFSQNISAAMQVMHAHIDGINARDGDAIARTLHFPHFRLSDGRLKIWENSESYLSDFRTRAGKGWSYSAWGYLNVVHAGDDKVHLDVLVERFTADGTRQIAFTSLWVIARLNGVWAAQLRSSFAPDARIIADGGKS